MTFERSLSAELATKLQNTPLFQERLKKDIEKGVVYPAIRNNCIDFYYKGGSLFGFTTSGMQTHAKYASVLRYRTHKNYVKQEDLEEAKPIASFVEGYERIKELCGLYAGDERGGVAEALTPWSYAKPGRNGSPVILDVEVCFASLSGNGKWDRIDVLLFNPEEKKPTLRFVEVKRFDNPELVSRSTPKVIQQLERYCAQLADREQQKHVVTQYRNYVTAANRLFGLDLPLPSAVDDHVGLLVFGFDDVQKNVIKEKMTPKLTKDGKDISVYCIGNIKRMNLNTLWNKTGNPGHATADS